MTSPYRQQQVAVRAKYYIRFQIFFKEILHKLTAKTSNKKKLLLPGRKSGQKKQYTPDPYLEDMKPDSRSQTTNYKIRRDSSDFPVLY